MTPAFSFNELAKNDCGFVYRVGFCRLDAPGAEDKGLNTAPNHTVRGGGSTPRRAGQAAAADTSGCFRTLGRLPLLSVPSAKLRTSRASRGEHGTHRSNGRSTTHFFFRKLHFCIALRSSPLFVFTKLSRFLFHFVYRSEAIRPTLQFQWLGPGPLGLAGCAGLLAPRSISLQWSTHYNSNLRHHASAV
jgi:hypothetical protein